jgi:beta-N-acetylhexosaminidase
LSNFTPVSSPLAAIFGLAGFALSADERRFFRDIRPLGYILFARNIADPVQVRALVDDLRGLTPDFSPLVLIDQEGGRVQRLRPPAWRAAPNMQSFGVLYGRDPSAAKRVLKLNMQIIGQELMDLGIDVDCAPVMDVPIPGAHDVIGDRAFSHDPAVVSALAPSVCEGLRAAGVVPVIKHIPGHGRAKADSHKELPVVDADLATLRDTDFVPFAAFPAVKLDAFAMTAHVVYSAIDPRNPATTSAKVIKDVIRGEIGFQGLLMSDDLCMKALTGPFNERAQAALAAGCDVVLHCDGNLADMEAVAAGCAPLGSNGLRALGAVASFRGKPAARVAADGAAQVSGALHG